MGNALSGWPLGATACEIASPMLPVEPATGDVLPASLVPLSGLSAPTW